MSNFEDWSTANPDEDIKAIREKINKDDRKIELPKVILTPRQFFGEIPIAKGQHDSLLNISERWGKALNSARVIEDFSKSLEKMKAEKIELIEWLKGAVSQCHESNNSNTLAMRSAYKHVLRKMGEDV